MKEEIMYGEVGVYTMSSKTTSNSKYTENWIPVKNIANGMIELDNHFKVTGVKIKPKNIFILDSNSRNNLIAMLKTFYDTIDFEFWLISADRPVDISGYLATLQVQYNQIQDPRIKKIISQDIEKANDFMRDNVTDTEYYILFKDKNPDSIQKRLRALMLGLANCGLDSVQTSNADLRIILDSFLNGGMNTQNKVVMPSEF
jgi:hypothetical protein